MSTHSNESAFQKDSVAVNGLHVVLNFISEEEESELVNAIDESEWVLSQSGRRKQVSCADLHTD